VRVLLDAYGSDAFRQDYFGPLIAAVSEMRWINAQPPQAAACRRRGRDRGAQATHELALDVVSLEQLRSRADAH
jgi:hypothetical protein